MTERPTGARPIGEFVNRVITGDCISVLAAMPSESVDAVITDPPYIARYLPRDGRTVPNDDNGAWLSPAFREIARVMKQDTFAVSFYGWPHADRFMAAWKAAGLRPVGHFAFVKGYASKTHFARYEHECAYLLAKGHPTLPSITIPDVLPWSYSGNLLHPTQKPLAAILPLVMAYTRPGDIVLDPFGGSGTTALAATILGRDFVTVELDPRYAEAARERLRRCEVGEKR